MKVFTTKNKLRSLLYFIISAVFWTALWAFAAYFVNRKLLLPSPFDTAVRLGQLAITREFWLTAGFSLGRILLGFAAGVAVGSLLAITTALSLGADILLAPLNTVIRATPVASFIILTLVWMKSGHIPSFIAFLMVTPIVWSSLKSAILTIDRPLQEMSSTYRIGFWRRLRLFYLPSVMPSYTASVITALGLAWKAGVAAEVLCRPRISLGNKLYESRIYLETADLFAWTAAIILLSVLMEAGFRLLLRRLSLQKGIAS